MSRSWIIIIIVIIIIKFNRVSLLAGVVQWCCTVILQIIRIKNPITDLKDNHNLSLKAT